AFPAQSQLPRIRALYRNLRKGQRRPARGGCDMRHHDAMPARLARLLVPAAVGLLFLAAWEALVAIYDIPRFVLPAPSAIWESFIQHFSSLMASLWVTLRVTIAAFLLAVVGGVGLAILFSQNRHVEMALFPYAVVLQVTPVVSI